MTDSRPILCVGLVCLDIITVCDGFPVEDTDQRCVDQLWQRGGNASNSCSIISLLGQPSYLLAVLADTRESRYLEEDLKLFGINTDHILHVKDYKTPCATILSNIRNGSRTILFSQRNLPEVSAHNFQSIDLASKNFGWIHFEGRPTVTDIEEMLRMIDDYNSSAPLHRKIRTSVELEKCRENLISLVDKADFVFISKEYAQWRGCSDMVSAVRSHGDLVRPGATIICPWGERGVAARSAGGEIVSSPAFPPGQIVDTLAAGDTCIGACITALSRGLSLHQSVTFGCRVAGAKCGTRGWENVQTLIQPIVSDLSKDRGKTA